MQNGTGENAFCVKEIHKINAKGTVEKCGHLVLTCYTKSKQNGIGEIWGAFGVKQLHKLNAKRY